MRENNTNEVWKKIWGKESYSSPKEVFNNRLFVEGYSVFSQYLPKDKFRFLDIGSGSGRYGVKFALHRPESSFVLTDILEESLVYIRSLADATGVKNVSIQKEDVFHLSFPDESFDVVFCDVVIQHVARDASAVQEMARVVKKGGVLIVAVVNRHSLHALARFLRESSKHPYEYGFERLYTKPMLVTLAESTGLSVAALDGFYPAYGIYRLKRYWSGFGSIGKIINRITRALDAITDRWVSRHFGFELVLVAKKP